MQQKQKNNTGQKIKSSEAYNANFPPVCWDMLLR